MTVSKLQSEAVKEFWDKFNPSDFWLNPENYPKNMYQVKQFLSDQIQKAVEETRFQDMYIVSKHMSSLGWSKYFNEDKYFDAVSCRENILQEIKKLSIQSKENNYALDR